MKCRRPWKRASALALVVVIGSAASPPETPEALWAGTIEESDGVVYVTNPAGPLWPSDSEPHLHLELEQVFGVDEEPAGAMLARIYDLAVGSDGHVYVLDYQDLRIVAFGPDGGVLWSAGREGEGPGELLRPLSIGLDGDTLYVTDRLGAQLDTWGTDGSFWEQTSLVRLGFRRAYALRALLPGRLGMVTGDHEPQTEVSVVDVRSEPTLVRSFRVDADSAPQHVARGRTDLAAGRIVTGSIYHVRGL